MRTIPRWLIIKNIIAKFVDHLSKPRWVYNITTEVNTKVSNILVINVNTKERTRAVLEDIPNKNMKA